MGWLDVLETGLRVGLPAVGQYLTTREQEQTAREVAKFQSGGFSLESMMQLITLGQAMQPQGPNYMTTPPPIPYGGYQYGGGYQTQPRFMTSPSRQNQFPTLPSTPTPPGLASPSGGTAMPAPYVQPAAGGGFSDIMPWIGGQVYDWMTAPSTGAGPVVPYQSDQSFVTVGPAGGARMRSLVEVPTPSGGKTWYRNVGRPILFSGDLRACKRVNKVAARARRASPRKRAATRRRR